jgi:hypothetical protein
MSKPRKQTIEKYTKFLEELSKIKTITKSDLYAMIKTFYLNNSIVSHLVSLNYIEHFDNKKFKVCLLKVMPIHAVELLYRLNSSRKIHKAATLTKTITASNSKNTPLKKLKAVVVDSELKQPRQFSILWGMLMIKW